MVQRNALIIEDHEVIREAYQFVLEEVGYRVTVASKGGQALTYLKTHPYELLLLDMHLPDINGLELLKIIRQNEAWRHIYTIFATGDRQALEIADGGLADLTMMKPISVIKLLPIVQKIYQSH